MYDPKDLSKPVSRGKIDNQSSTMQLHLNSSNNLVYVLNKGSHVLDIFYHDVRATNLVKLT